jgi:hypothetical protein
MLFDMAAWAVLSVVAGVAGTGVPAVLGAESLRIGDRIILGTWTGVVILSSALLATALFAPLTPGLTLLVAGLFAGVAGAAVWRTHRDSRARRRPAPDAPVPSWARALGLAIIAVGAASLASDPVTLYDSLVYHVGIIRWLHEHGVVPGIALIHIRLGHVSAWFTLAAAFDTGPASARAANVPLGLALILVSVQGAIGCARIAAGRAAASDWFLVLASAALLFAGVAYNAATPSPDVAANTLIVIVAWSLLIVPRAGRPTTAHGWRRWLGPRLIPFIIAVGASAMKPFALPAAAVAAVFYVFARADDRGARDAATRAAICAALGLVLLAPFLAANVAASGCPLFPSPIGCLTTTWSVGAARAADYTEYIRDVARWVSRNSMAGASRVPWIGHWITEHPVVTVLSLLSPLLAPLLLLRGPRRDGLRSALLLAVCGIAFAAWQAPAPRFLYAFVIVVPALALMGPLTSAKLGRLPAPASDVIAARRAATGFVSSAVVAALAFAVASQKVNVRSAFTGRAILKPNVRAELVLPAAAPQPLRLYHWRVNDVDILTPVPRPIADTLGYRSSIDGDIGFEKCSTAPLPCTPYLPAPDVRLRMPSLGLRGGFVRQPSSGRDLSATAVRCLGEVAATGAAMVSLHALPLAAGAASRCGQHDDR